MSLFDLHTTPELLPDNKLKCPICKGIMHEQRKPFLARIFSSLNIRFKLEKLYRCEECDKECYITEKK